MDEKETYDCIIAGGGIAGLSLSIQLSAAGFNVLLLEKHRYPFHKVCGEYLSNESRAFFMRLGMDLDPDLPEISRLGISSSSGFMMQAGLPLGGIGISRYRLDQDLYNIALQRGVRVLEGCKVSTIKKHFVTSNMGEFKGRCIAVATGKALPGFLQPERKKKKNYVGVKYHVKYDLAPDRIELHNFSSGYCGISKVEGNKYCLCYLADSDQLRACGNSISRLENEVLGKNPYLRRIFREAEFLFHEPVTVSNIEFSVRNTAVENMLVLGDAAGCISPLTGNGMSMAARASAFAAEAIDQFLRGELSEAGMLRKYQNRWQQEFRFRIWRGRQLQRLFGKPGLTDAMLRLLDPMKGFKQAIIRSTHGQEF